MQGAIDGESTHAAIKDSDGTVAVQPVTYSKISETRTRKPGTVSSVSSSVSWKSFRWPSARITSTVRFRGSTFQTDLAPSASHNEVLPSTCDFRSLGDSTSTARSGGPDR